jgi:hypothetical protein
MTDVLAELAALRADLERMKARDSIVQQLTRYGRGQEWVDVTLMDEVFWDDADVDFGFFKGVWSDYRPILMAMQAGSNGSFHLTTSPQIEFEGETTAYVECYGIAGGPRGDSAQLYGGRYFHRFERRGGHWRSARCYYVLDWKLRGVEETPLSTGLEGINKVTDRSPNHPWFRRMGQDATG